jgi:hypothetical protein
VFAETSTGWHQVAELAGSGTVARDGLGCSVAVSSTTVVAGTPGRAPSGRAFVFAKTPTSWYQVAELKGSEVVGGEPFGSSVAVSGNTVVVGAPSARAAYVFMKAPTGWYQAARLKDYGALPVFHFGESVAVSGNTVVVGAPSPQNATGGLVYVFVQTATGWHQVGGFCDSESGYGFGDSVAVSGTTIAVGAPGRAYVFDKTAMGWERAAKFNGPGDDSAWFGSSVAISRTTVVVGDETESLAHVFANTAAGWHQVAELKGSRASTYDYPGSSVAISGSTIVVGSAGNAYVFAKTPTGWHQTAELKDPRTTTTSGWFGTSVAVSGSTIVVGDPRTYSGRIGVAYVFTKVPTGWAQAAELKGSAVRGDELGYSVAISGTSIVAGGPGYGSTAGRAYVLQA